MLSPLATDADLRALAASALPRPRYRTRVVKERYTTDDIVREILARFRASHGEVRALAARIGRERPLRDTAHLIYRLLKHIQYRRDPEGVQDVKAPAVTWADGYGDCKSYAVFAGSLLYHLGIPFRFRFTTWEPGEVKHVYVVATSEDGTEVVIDPTLRSFGIEDYYIQKRDYPIMPLRSIDGPSHALGLGCPPSLGCPADPRMAVAQQRARIAQASGRVYWDATNDQVTKVLTDALEVMNYPQCAVRAERLAHSVAEIAVPVGMRYGVPPPPGTLALYALGRRPEIGIAPLALPLAAGAPLAASTAAGAAATPSFLAKAAGFIMPLLQKFGAPLVEFLKKIPLVGKVLGFVRGPESDPAKYRGIAAISAYFCVRWAEKAEGYYGWVEDRLARKAGKPTVSQEFYDVSDWLRTTSGPVQVQQRADAEAYWQKRIGGNPADIVAAWMGTDDPNPLRVSLAKSAETETANDKHKRTLEHHRLVKAVWFCCPGDRASVQALPSQLDAAASYLVLQGIDPRRLSLAQIDQNLGTLGSETLFGPQVLQALGATAQDTPVSVMQRMTPQVIAQLPGDLQAYVQQVQQQLVLSGQQVANPNAYAAAQGGSAPNGPGAPTASGGMGALLPLALGGLLFFLR